MLNYTNKFKILLNKSYERFVKIRGHPREIALGFSLGIFISMTPFMGLHMLIAIPIAALLKWSKLAAGFGVWLSNPITAPVIYPLTYVVGKKITGGSAPFQMPNDFSYDALVVLLEKSPEVLGKLIVGGMVVGFPLAVAGYFFAYSAVVKYRGNIKAKILEKAQKVRKKPAAK